LAGLAKITPFRIIESYKCVVGVLFCLLVIFHLFVR